MLSKIKESECRAGHGPLAINKVYPMNFTQLNLVLQETKLSPEQLAPVFDVGSMTVRRWQKEPGAKKVPSGHRWSIIQSIYKLVLEGKLSTESPAVRDLLQGSTPLSFTAIIKGMGVSDTVLSSKDNQQGKMMRIISQIGENEAHKKEVDRNAKKLSYFEKLGSEWKKRITLLTKVIRSSKLTTMDKLVAYGALFYLITPFDLIPDHIPVIGLLDDFGILGFAVAYYVKRYPDIVGTTKND